MKEIEYWKSTQLESYPNEEWRDIPNYEGLYQVSNLGRVKNLERQVRCNRGYMTKRLRILKQYLNRKGYPEVRLSKNGIDPSFRVHRLVAMTWLENPDNQPQIDHINTIKTDNRVENLQFTTGFLNNRNPLTCKHRSEGLKGHKGAWEGKLGQEHSRAIPVIQLTLDGHFVKTWGSIIDVERELGIHHSGISNTLRGKSNHAGGYKWVYLSEYNKGV